MKAQLGVLLAVLTAGAVALQAFGPHPAHGHWWDGVPGAYAVFGFVGCAAIVVVSKWVGKRFVQRREGYYGRP